MNERLFAHSTWRTNLADAWIHGSSSEEALLEEYTMGDAWQAELDDMEKNLKQSLINKASLASVQCHPMTKSPSICGNRSVFTHESVVLLPCVVYFTEVPKLHIHTLVDS